MSRRRLVVALGALVLGVGLSCVGPRNATVHVVKPGENLYRIAGFYEVPVQEILRANRVRDVRALPVGTRLHIPGTRKQAPSYALPAPRGSETPSEAAARARIVRKGLRFAWPVRGKLTSRFGWRRGRPHEGIDVATRTGTPVRAAEAGRVIYSARLGAYGKVVIVRHAGGYETVYAHNRKNRVAKGARVARGQVLAELGSTGNATGPHLHFEIRHHDRARDPLKYLP